MVAELTAEQQANLTAFRRLIDEGFSGGNVAVVDEVCSDHLLEHQPGMNPPNRDGVKSAIRFLHRLAPDFRLSFEDVAVVGDRVWARLAGAGTHTGDILGGPSGRRFEITVMDVCRFKAGKIAEHWGVPDRFSQFEQLGLMPVLGPSAARPSR